MINLLCAQTASLWERMNDAIFTKFPLYMEGLKNTLIMAVCAAAIGVVLGALIALVRYLAKLNSKWKIPAAVCNVYVTVVRGTPVVLQLLLMGLVILVSVKEGIVVAVITFGLNSAAYVSEIVRGGLESVDAGQLEAGRSLGFGVGKTLWYVILPQAIRKAVPPLGNELIALVKETSVAGYVAVVDLTLAAQKMTSAVFEVFIPLVFVGLIYLVIVLLLTWLLKKLERRLAKSDRN